MPAHTLSRHSDSTTTARPRGARTPAARGRHRGRRGRSTPSVGSGRTAAMTHCAPAASPGAVVRHSASGRVRRCAPAVSHRCARIASVPELPEVEALALDLRGRLDRPCDHPRSTSPRSARSRPSTRRSRRSRAPWSTDVTRHGKFLDIDASGLHLVIHLARAGWVRWRDEVPTLPPRPSSKSPLACGWCSTTAVAASTSPRPAPRSGWPSTSYATRRTCPASRGSGPTRSTTTFTVEVLRADPPRRRARPAQGRAAPPGDHRRDRQRLLRRDAARREDVAVQAGVDA